MTGTTKRLARLTVAVVFVVPTLLLGSLVTSSSAAPTKAEVDAAKAHLQEVSEKLEVVIEQYNEAKVRLGDIQDKLDAALADKQEAEAEAAAATKDLEARAVEAYTGSGNQLDVLLGAQDLTEFSDRLEFMGALAQNDADLATQAANARQRAEWAAQQYGEALDQQKAELSKMSANREDIQAMLQEQQALYEQLNKDYQDYLARQEAAAAAAAAAEQNTGSTSPAAPRPVAAEAPTRAAGPSRRPRRPDPAPLPRLRPRRAWSAPRTCGVRPTRRSASTARD